MLLPEYNYNNRTTVIKTSYTECLSFKPTVYFSDYLLDLKCVSADSCMIINVKKSTKSPICTNYLTYTHKYNNNDKDNLYSVNSSVDFNNALH
jgi:hypothetical protein